MSNYDDPSHECPIEVGDTVMVRGTISATNDCGGTKILKLPRTPIACVVTKRYWDHETGWRFHGRVVDLEIVENFRVQTTKGFTADHYREKYPNNPEIAENAAKAARDYDPGKVYFSERDLAKTS